MRLSKGIIFAVLLTLVLSANAQSGLNAPMTKAVMGVYEQLLKEDPSDHDTYFRRGCEYYKHNQYNLALNDINNALKYVPAAETATRVEYLTLRANIYERQNKFIDALNDLGNACALNPDSYLVIYQKANIEFQLGKYQDAKADYLRMQRINNRSQEALIGLARVAVKENNLGLANEYLDQAVAIAPSNSDIYVRRASVRQLMGNDNGAVDDLILAISTDNTNTRALQQLVSIGDTNYPAVMAGLSNAIRQAPRVGMFYYIRAVISEARHNYTAAISDYQKIIDENLYNYSGIYNSLAKCEYALAQYAQALDNIDYALAGTSSNEDYYMTKARILRAIGNTPDALKYINKAIDKNPSLNDALIEKSMAMIETGDYDKASALLGEASLNDAYNARLYLLRAWVLDKHMGQKNNANAFYQRALDCADNGSMKSLRGFALFLTGKPDEAKTWTKSILDKNSDIDGIEHYIATCFYAQAGEYELALQCMEKALDKGYANYHDWTNETDGPVNVAPIRHLPGFSSLLNRYSIIFNR